MNAWIESFVPVLAASLAQAPAPAAPTHAPGLVATAWDMVMKGGWSMIPLAVCSLAAMTIVVERLVVTRRSRVAPPALLRELNALRATPGEARTRCAALPHVPVAGVILAVIASAHEKRDVADRLVAEAGEREVLKLRRRMRVLSALPQIATMLGLLGTVVGMIRTFTVVAASGEALGKAERLAQGIYEAWTATAVGLVIAIPTILMYQILLSRIDAAAGALDAAAQDWQRPDPAALPVSPSPASLPNAAGLSRPGATQPAAAP